MISPRHLQCVKTVRELPQGLIGDRIDDDLQLPPCEKRSGRPKQPKGYILKLFTDYALSDVLLENLNVINFTEPTPIQQAAIPVALEGRDILGTAQTGTGKTAAFALPILTKLIEDENAKALILAPTRELAAQIHQAVSDIAQKEARAFNVTLVVGGASMHKQINALKKKPRLIVATPGRLNDHIRNKKVKLYDFNLLALDEADQMLDMGFTPQIEEIMKQLPEERQTLFFTATLSKPIEKMAHKYLKNPERIGIGPLERPVDKIKQSVRFIDGKEKRDALLDEIGQREGSILVFTRTKRTTDGLDKYLHGYGVKVAKIHGDCRQSHRTRALNGFRSGKYTVLIATNVAARGLDIPHIEHVVNFDLPEDREDYIHRIGRTARAGGEGESIALVTPEERSLWDYISGAIKRKPRTGGGRGGRRGGRGRGRGEPSARGDRGARGGDRTERNDRSEQRGERRERGNREDRGFRGGRNERNDRNDRGFRGGRNERNDRGFRGSRNERNDRGFRGERSERSRDDRSFAKPRRFKRDENFGDRRRARDADSSFGNSRKPARRETTKKASSGQGFIKNKAAKKKKAPSPSRMRRSERRRKMREAN